MHGHEVGFSNFHIPLQQPQVVRFDVAVDHVLAVQVVQGLCRRAEVAEELIRAVD